MLPALDMHAHIVQSPETEEAVGGEAILSVTFTADEWQTHAASSAPGKVVWALGMHPWETSGPEQLGAVIEHLTECDAIGEVGIDGTDRARLPVPQQMELLTSLLDEPIAKQRIVSLHGYHAYDEVVELLSRHPVPGAIYHWFMGKADTLRRAVELDIFFSVNHNMFSLAEGRQVIGALPRTRILIETDAPYIDLSTGRARTVRVGSGEPGWTMKLDENGRQMPEEAHEVSEPLLPGKVVATETGLACMWNVELHEVRPQLWRNLAELESRISHRPFRAESVLRELGT